MNSQYVDPSENQARQLTDAQAIYRVKRAASNERLQTRGSMIWRELRGVTYLIRISSGGAQKVIGPSDSNNELIYTRFQQRKEAAKDRYKALKEKFLEQKKLNRVYRVGRAPSVLIKILQSLEKFGTQEQFLVAGTHSMSAYESACGVHLLPDSLATRDVDFDVNVTTRHLRNRSVASPSATTVFSQYKYWAREYAGDLVLMQIGVFLSNCSGLSRAWLGLTVVG